MGGRWSYSCWFLVYCLQDLFNIAQSILVQLPSSFFSIRLVSAHVVHPYSSIDTTVAWKKLRFILSDRFKQPIPIQIICTPLYSFKYFFIIGFKLTNDNSSYTIIDWLIQSQTRAIGLMSRVFANSLGDLGFNPRSSHTKDSKNGTWCHLA